jgi:hypothetical protein
MLLRIALGVVMCLIGLAPISADEPADKSTVRAEIHLAEDEPAGELMEAVIVGTDDKVYLHKAAVATSADIAEASVILDALGRPAIAITFTDDGSKKIAEVTDRHNGKRLAILVDGQVISAPIIRAQIVKKAKVTGNFSQPEAQRIVKALHDNAEPADSKAPAVVPHFVDLFNGRDLSGWVNVNTGPDTWQVKDGLLVCSGLPIGVMRSEKQYENFVLHIEWRHMKPGGNSGVFVWSEGFVPDNRRLPKGMEVQMLEMEWVNLHRKANGAPQDIGYISGELFGANGLTATPDNPRGSRSKSLELRCKGAGEWNVYDVVCVDGTVKLSINGKFVNSIRNSSMRKGYLCLESEGSEIHFRNIRIFELPPGITSPEQTATVIE